MITQEKKFLISSIDILFPRHWDIWFFFQQILRDQHWIFVQYFWCLLRRSNSPLNSLTISFHLSLSGELKNMTPKIAINAWCKQVGTREGKGTKLWLYKLSICSRKTVCKFFYSSYWNICTSFCFCVLDSFRLPWIWGPKFSIGLGGDDIPQSNRGWLTTQLLMVVISRSLTK